MFYGEYIHHLDRKGRLILPAKFREIAKEYGIEKFFLTRGLDKCIFMFTDEEWRSQEQKFKNVPFLKQQARAFNRMFFSGAVDIIPDKQGRFIIPSFLKEFAGIKKDTVIIGVSNRIEIWDTQTWKDFYNNSLGTFEEIAEQIFDGS